MQAVKESKILIRLLGRDFCGLVPHPYFGLQGYNIIIIIIIFIIIIIIKFL